MKNRAIVTGLFCLGLVACGSAEKPAKDEPAAVQAVAGSPESGSPSEPAIPEPIAPGDEYSATTILDCGFDGAAPTQKCNAGVKRNWGDAGDEALVEVFKPDGRKRAIFFRGTEPYGADSAQSDGSAGWDFTFSRKDDSVTVTFGPETYVVVDALITGG